MADTPPFRIEKRFFKQFGRDSWGYPTGAKEWGPWHLIVEFYDRTRAEHILKVFQECPSFMADGSIKVDPNHEYRLVEVSLAS